MIGSSVKRNNIDEDYPDKKLRKHCCENEAVETTPNNLNMLITSTAEPIVLKNILDWDILKWDHRKWQEVLKDETLEFRRGRNCHTNLPQWEVSCDSVAGKFTDIWDYSSDNNEHWIYYDYKYLQEHLLNIKELRKAVCWNILGLDNIDAEDSVLWIGSKGAHTSLHKDTYGYNVIAQIFGRKLWLLFPPDTNLKETRTPYEESSIYSKYNMFSPDAQALKGINNCRKIVLNPGEILILPHRWWHYVENLEPAISINTWRPMPNDDEERLQESITEMLIMKMAANLPKEAQKLIINPNMEKYLSEDPIESYNLINRCLSSCISRRNGDNKKESSDKNSKIATLINTSDNIEVVPVLQQKEYEGLLENQRNRFTVFHDQQMDESFSSIVNVIDAVTSSEVVSLIKTKLLEQ